MRTAITFSENHLGHAKPGHIERPERLQITRTLLEQDGMLHRLAVLPAKPAQKGVVQLVHPEDYYDRLETAVTAGGAQLDPDTYATPNSLDTALEALGGLISVTDEVLGQEYTNGFAIVRPPGHHARPNEAMGFCLFANIAIAAHWAKKHYDIEKVLIVDFDVHHGNGTQEIFYHDPSVMYMSTHQWPLYPGTGALEETGAGPGKGATLNLPLPAGTGDADYLTAFKRILAPIALDFNPDIIFISAGYDAHWMDLIGGMNLTVTGFAAIVREILSWAAACCGHKAIALLEGGYHANALAHCVLTTLRLLQDPQAAPSDPFGNSGRPDADVSFYLEKLAEFHAM